MPLEVLLESGGRLVQGLHRMMPEAVIDTRLFSVAPGNTP
ncbi:hypothetical protein SAMN05443545_10138 [Aidingimonas halophila]|uniref:Uncharacterized protein n=1 Tax=Aidingimonas halophila TaxID=574349 RepID=A0A1H2QAK5_9GAMM|nr:hypothetical protein SAMN05443545_10138 [Aidingimonas halophila]